jgi:uncharacterized protein with HEPN domain
MRPEDAVAGLLWDMREAARAAVQFVEGRSYAEFISNLQLRLAIERSLEIVGEAARRVFPDFKAGHPEIPWSAVVGQRNVIAHEYGDIDYAQIWERVSHHLPELISQLDALIPPIPGKED